MQKVGLVNIWRITPCRLCLSSRNAALLARAVPNNHSDQEMRGRDGEGGIEMEGLEMERLARKGLKEITFVYCNLRNNYITQCYLQLHCWTKKAVTPSGFFSKLGFFVDFLYRGAVKLWLAGGARSATFSVLMREKMMGKVRKWEGGDNGTDLHE